MAAPPLWLATLANEIARRIVPVDPLGPIGCHYALHDAMWEVTLFVSTTEVVGGKHDGQAFASAFQLDLAGIELHFDSVSSVGWQPIELNDDDDLGPHVAVIGTREGHAVWLRVTAVPPRGFDSGRVMNLLDTTVRDVW